jgi:hypothetical protein
VDESDAVTPESSLCTFTAAREGAWHLVVAPNVALVSEETESEMGLADAGAGGYAAELESAAQSVVPPVAWRRSSRCSTQSCVEVADLPGGSVAVRDSKASGQSPVLVFEPQEWESFISGVKAGEFG